MSELLHRIAIAGNTCALVVLVLLCANADILFGPSSEDQGPARAANPRATTPVRLAGGAASPPRRAVLVVVDGLRVDTSSDPRVMPFLSELASRGGVATANVESLVPSTVAGISALAAGRVLPPGSFLHDFRSPAAPDGGVFAAVQRSGGQSFVAGPRLWTDMYGRWITASRTLETFVGPEAP